jgi:hypothetical protein
MRTFMYCRFLMNETRGHPFYRKKGVLELAGAVRTATWMGSVHAVVYSIALEKRGYRFLARLASVLRCKKHRSIASPVGELFLDAQ